VVYHPSRPYYLETVGKERASTWADLDTIKAIWDGPSSLADTAPAVGSPHPIYPNMELASRQKIVTPGGITRWQLEYVGLESGATVGPIKHGDSQSEQELSYQQFYISSVLNPGNPTGGLAAFSTYEVGSLSSVLRYQSANDIIQYVAKGRPNGARFQSQASPTARISFIRPTSRSAPTVLGSMPTINFSSVVPGSGPELSFGSGIGGTLNIAQFVGSGPWGYDGPNEYLMQFGSVSISPSWYRCIEIWGMRYLAGTLFTV
jgi:hypothetical protein